MSQFDATGASSAVCHRYADAYLVARTINGFGDTIKAIGIAAGLLLGLLAFLVAAKGGAGILIAVVGVVFAACIATIVYLLGTLVAAQGQILTATLDTAVNSSTFLSDEQRAEIMALPRGGAALRDAVAQWKCVCGQPNAGAVDSCQLCGAERVA